MPRPPFPLQRYNEAALLNRLGFARGITAKGIAYVHGGEGPLLVLMHGGSGSWNHWLFNLQGLAERFRVVALDLPGFGASKLTDIEIGKEAFLDLVTAAVLELADAAGPVHLAGFSFGSMVAVAVALRLPARTASLSLIGPAGFKPPLERTARPYGLRKLREGLGREPDATELREMHRNNFSEIMLSNPARLDDPIVDLHIANVTAARFNSRQISWSGDMLPLLGRLNLPVLALYGLLDRTQYPTIASRVAEMMQVYPGLEVIALRDCGHWAMYECQARVDRALIEFHLAV